MKKIILFLLLGTIVTQLFAQKIKYKDLFPLLEAKSYEQGEPQLRTFLSNEKNAEEPNANLQFGFLLDKYFQEGDILENRDEVFAYGDSAIQYLNKAIELIDEKELRKNDQYYQSFYRRDLRTGEFGIKVSDVHLDIEKRVEAIELRKTNADKFGQILESIVETEKSLLSAFNNLVESHDSYNDYLLRVAVDDLSNLTTLTDFQDKIEENSQEVSEIAKTLGLGGQYKELAYIPVTDFAKLDPVFNKAGKMQIHNVKQWTSEARTLISGEVATLKRRIQVLNDKLAVSKQELEEGVFSSFPPRLSPQMIDLAEKYDANNAPIRLLGARISENIIISLTNAEVNEDWQDSTQIAYHVVTCDSILSEIQNVKDAVDGLASDIEASGPYYSAFYNAGFGSVADAAAYVNNLNDWADQQKIKWDTLSGFWNVRNQWGLGASDTIPLGRPESWSGVFQTLGRWEAGEFDLIPFGVKKDSTIGFVARFGPDRQLIWENRFASELLAGDTLGGIQVGKLNSSSSDLAFYLFDPSKSEGENNLTVLSLSLDGMLNWSVDLSVEQQPDHDSYNESIRQHTLYLFTEDQYPLEGGKLGYVIINSNGEAQQ